MVLATTNCPWDLDQAMRRFSIVLFSYFIIFVSIDVWKSEYTFRSLIL